MSSRPVPHPIDFAEANRIGLSAENMGMWSKYEISAFYTSILDEVIDDLSYWKTLNPNEADDYTGDVDVDALRRQRDILANRSMRRGHLRQAMEEAQRNAQGDPNTVRIDHPH